MVRTSPGNKNQENSSDCMYDQEELRLSDRSAIAPVGDRHMFELKSRRVVEEEQFGNPADGYDNRDKQFLRIQRWTRGSIWLRERPDLSQYDEKNGLNLYALFEDFDYSFEDGEHRFVFPDSMPTSTQERIRALDEADMLSEDGWEVFESETRFFGPLEIIEAE